jgi:hypothetical protein
VSSSRSPLGNADILHSSPVDMRTGRSVLPAALQTRNMNGGTMKSWNEMTVTEKIAASKDPLMFKGKRFSELSDEEQAELWRADHRRFERMKEAG